MFIDQSHSREINGLIYQSHNREMNGVVIDQIILHRNNKWLDYRLITCTEDVPSTELSLIWLRTAAGGGRAARFTYGGELLGIGFVSIGGSRICSLPPSSIAVVLWSIGYWCFGLIISYSFARSTGWRERVRVPCSRPMSP